MKKYFIATFAMLFTTTAMAQTGETIGGKIDEKWCLTVAGYTWDATLSECVQVFDGGFLYKWASKTEVTTAKNLEEFALDTHISRAEVAALVERLMDKNLVSGGHPNHDNQVFADEKDISPEFKESIKLMQKYGIMKGNNGKFLPKDNLTTFEALTILSRATLSGEVYNATDAMNFAKNLHLTLDNKTLNEKISRKDFFHFIYLASDMEKKIIAENEKNSATRGEGISVGVCAIGFNSPCNADKYKTPQK